jgi:hypothetical protein
MNYLAVNVHGGCVQHVQTIGAVSYDVLDWDNYDHCRCNPEENVVDPDCSDHDAEEIGYDHAVYLFLEGKAGPPSTQTIVPATALEPDDD